MRSMKNRKLHGSVLLTVVAVMSLLIIFLFGTLALATATNNRAHVNYSQAQSGITARTVVDVAFKTLGESKEFASAFNKIDENSGVMDIPVSFSGTGFGHINSLTAEYAGERMFYNSKNKEWKKYPIVKLAANVTMGGVTSQATAYIVKDPPNPGGGGGGGAGFVTTGGANFACQSSLWGGTYLNLPTEDEAGKYNYNNKTLKTAAKSDEEEYKTRYLSGKTFSLPNTGCLLEAEAVINGNLNTDQLTQIYFPGKGTGVTIWGNMKFNDKTFSSLEITAHPNLTVGNSTLNFKDIPYIYIDGEASGSVKLGPTTTNNDEAFPFNAFIGSINVPDGNNKAYLSGDIYLMDPGANNVYLPGNERDSNLYTWSSSVINKVQSATNLDKVGGNICCKGNLTIGGKDKDGVPLPIVVNGDLRVEGDLTVPSGRYLTVNGKLVVGGTITADGVISASNIYANKVMGTNTSGGSTESITIPGTPEIPESSRNVAYLATNYTVIRPDWGNQIVKYNVVLDADMYDPTGKDATKISLKDFNKVTVVDDNGNAAEAYDMSAMELLSLDDTSKKYPTTAMYSINDKYNFVHTETVEITPAVPAVPEHTIEVYSGGNSKIGETAVKSITDFTNNGANPIYPAYAERAVIIGKQTCSDTTGTTLATTETQVVKRMDQILKEVIDPYKSSALPAPMSKAKDELKNNDSPKFTSASSLGTVSKEMGEVAEITRSSDGSVNISYPSTGGAEVNFQNVSQAPVISKSCILDGFSIPNGIKSSMPAGTYAAKNRAVVFNPGTGNMLVVIRNTVSVGDGINFIIDDSKGGKVYFYLEDGAKLKFESGCITTQKYIELFSKMDVAGSNVSGGVQIYTADERKRVDSNGLENPISFETLKLGAPGAYFYSEPNTELTIGNTEYIAANIISSDLKVTVAATSASLTDGKLIYYDGIETETAFKRVSGPNSHLKYILGCCNSHETDFPNEMCVLYIPDSKTKSTVTNNDLNNWYELTYYDEY